MRERVAADGARHLADDRVLHGLIERVEQLVAARSAGGFDRVEVELRADHRRDRERPVRSVGKSRQPAADHLADPLGHARLLRACGHSSSGRRAARSRPTPRDGAAPRPRRTGCPASRAARRARGRRPGRRGRDPRRSPSSAITSDWSRPTRSSRVDARLAPEIGEHLGERVRAVEVGVAIRREHEAGASATRRAARGAAAATTACRPSARRRARGSPGRSATSRRGSRSRLRTAGGARSRDRPSPERPGRDTRAARSGSMRVSSPPSGPSSARSRSTGTHAE